MAPVDACQHEKSSAKPSPVAAVVEVRASGDCASARYPLLHPWKRRGGAWSRRFSCSWGPRFPVLVTKLMLEIKDVVSIAASGGWTSMRLPERPRHGWGPKTVRLA